MVFGGENEFPSQDIFHRKLSSPAFLPVHVLNLSFRTVPALDSLRGIQGNVSQGPARLDEAPTPQDLEQPRNKLAPRMTTMNLSKLNLDHPPNGRSQKFQFTGLPSLPSRPTCSPQHTRVPPEPRTWFYSETGSKQSHSASFCHAMPTISSFATCNRLWPTSVLTWCRKGPMSHTGGASE